jgi:hypothetical protein
MVYSMMIVSFIFSVIVPLLLCAWGALRRAESRLVWYARWFLILSYGSTIAWLGFWSIFGPICRYAVVFGLIAGLIVGIRRLRTAPVFACTNKKQWALVSLWLVLGLVNLSGLPEVLKARTFEGPAIEMTFPLATGTYSVFHGGSAGSLNHHAVVSAQRYGLDIIALNTWGTRASGIFPESLSDYEVFGKTIVAPCSGRVAMMQSDLPDQAPGEMSSENVLGNHLVLHCAQHSVILAHLEQGSVLVEVDQEVNAGTPVGRVGNTGNTSEPHLHIHTITGLANDLETLAWEGEGVPMTFGGNFLIRGDTQHVQ